VRPLRSTLAGVAALLVVAFTTTACDTSPYAAEVNSQVIHQAELNAELGAWARNPVYVSSYNSASTNGTVAGDAPGTYNTTWVAGILSGMVDASVVRQQVVATGKMPSSASLAAARSVNEIGQVGWSDFSAAFRDVLVSRLADEAVLTPVAVPQATMLSAYHQYLPYFFLQVCTVSSSAFNAGQAAGIAAHGVPNGVPFCYDQSLFEAQPPAFQHAVVSTQVGKVAAPIKTSYGYQVVKVTSRAVQPYTPELQQVLSLVINSGQGNANPVITGLLAKASVRINPAYGTWSSLQVKPPAVPNGGS
jgi:hypothetical protein